jgi:hypothetical protein
MPTILGTVLLQGRLHVMRRERESNASDSSNGLFDAFQARQQLGVLPAFGFGERAQRKMSMSLALAEKFRERVRDKYTRASKVKRLPTAAIRTWYLLCHPRKLSAQHGLCLACLGLPSACLALSLCDSEPLPPVPGTTITTRPQGAGKQREGRNRRAAERRGDGLAFKTLRSWIKIYRRHIQRHVQWGVMKRWGLDTTKMQHRGLPKHVYQRALPFSILISCACSFNVFRQPRFQLVHPSRSAACRRARADGAVGRSS